MEPNAGDDARVSRRDGPHGLARPLSVRALTALELVLDAYCYASDLRVPIADFAVSLGTLQRHAVAEIDLRWLVAKGYLYVADHGRVDSGSPHAADDFSLGTSFVISERGVGFARRVFDGRQVDVLAGPDHPPVWDASRRELRLGTSVVKRFRVPAPNQELVLASFQEEGWPPHLEDPLPPQRDIPPKRRLHDTIIALNSCQSTPGIKFQGDGRGSGVCWERRP